MNAPTAEHVAAAKHLCDQNPMGNARCDGIAQLLADQTAADQQRIADLEAEVARERHEKEMVVKAGAGVAAMKAALDECLEQNADLKKDCERFIWNLEACQDLGDLRGGAMFDARIFDKEWVHPAFESVNRMYQDLRKAQGLPVKESTEPVNAPTESQLQEAQKVLTEILNRPFRVEVDLLARVMARREGVLSNALERALRRLDEARVVLDLCKSEVGPAALSSLNAALGEPDLDEAGNPLVSLLEKENQKLRQEAGATKKVAVKVPPPESSINRLFSSLNGVTYRDYEAFRHAVSRTRKEFGVRLDVETLFDMAQSYGWLSSKGKTLSVLVPK